MSRFWRRDGPAGTLSTAQLNGVRLCRADLASVKRLMADPRVHAHKPAPMVPPANAIAQTHADDLAHWPPHGFGRYGVHLDGVPMGLRGLTRREGVARLNLSNHLAPAHWDSGFATELVRKLVDLARDDPPGQGPVYGLARPANPASDAVLRKAGFIRGRELMRGGAPTVRWKHAL